jgi:hypothetical protein
MLRDIFPGWRYSSPATPEAIAGVEAALSARFPSELKALYLESDGVRESLGSAAYLLPLTAEVGESLVRLTRFYWGEGTEYWPQLDFSRFIFFGSSSSDHAWGINWKQPGQVIAFHHNMEDEYEDVGTNIIDVYRKDFAWFESLKT